MHRLIVESDRPRTPFADVFDFLNAWQETWEIAEIGPTAFSRGASTWIFLDIDVRQITVSYRQSRQLNDLARSLSLLADHTGHLATLPDRVDNGR
jgi:hypothetical protein